MNLPNDIRLKIEKSPDKEDILLLLARLAGRVYLANAFSCVHLQGETVSCG